MSIISTPPPTHSMKDGDRRASKLAASRIEESSSSFKDRHYLKKILGDWRWLRVEHLEGFPKGRGVATGTHISWLTATYNLCSKGSNTCLPSSELKHNPFNSHILQSFGLPTEVLRCYPILSVGKASGL